MVSFAIGTSRNLLNTNSCSGAAPSKSYPETAALEQLSCKLSSSDDLVSSPLFHSWARKLKKEGEWDIMVVYNGRCSSVREACWAELAGAMGKGRPRSFSCCPSLLPLLPACVCCFRSTRNFLGTQDGLIVCYHNLAQRSRFAYSPKCSCNTSVHERVMYSQPLASSWNQNF